MIECVKKPLNPSHEMANVLARFRALRKNIEGTVDIPSLIKAGRKY